MNHPTNRDPPAPSPEALDGHAIVIGVSRYQRIPSLPAVRDAEDIAAVLRDPALCAYPPQQVQVLLDEQATRTAILAALDRLAAEARPTSTAFLYFSGHGGRPADGSRSDCYLMPVDSAWRSNEDLSRTAIGGSELSERLRGIRAKRLTVVLDCCRAAGIAEPKDAQASALETRIPAQALARLAQGRSRAVFAASRADGFAYAQEGQRNGIFTHYLLDGLRGGACGTGGIIRVFDLFTFVQQKVTVDVPEQRPVFKAEVEENYPLALYRGGAAPPLVVPKAADGCTYDAFVSYRRKSPDREWVEGVLVPSLESLGLRLCLAHRDFRLGSPHIREMERAVETSRYTLAVLTPQYLEGSFEEFQTLMAQHLTLEEHAPRFIPLMRRECRPPLGIRTTEWLDVQEAEFEKATVERLAQRLREPQRMLLTTGA